jgi:hypothetical protein
MIIMNYARELGILVAIVIFIILLFRRVRQWHLLWQAYPYPHIKVWLHWLNDDANNDMYGGRCKEIRKELKSWAKGKLARGKVSAVFLYEYFKETYDVDLHLNPNTHQWFHG